MSMWKTAMTWLGLGPDVDYEARGDDAGRGFADPALSGAGPAPAIGAPGSAARSGDAGNRPADFSAVRSLGPMSDADSNLGSYAADPLEPLSNTTLRPVEVAHSHDDQAIGSVRPIPSNVVAKPQIVAPRSFNDAQEVADRFRGGAPVVLNLRETDTELGRRLIDFCSGLCYGLRGSMSKASDRVFLVVPSDVSLTPEDHRVLRESGLVN